MPNDAMTSNKLVDDLVRRFFGLGPDAMAALAHGDEPVRLRRLPLATPTIDPLDGLDVFVRRVLAACLLMKKHRGRRIAADRAAGSGGGMAECGSSPTWPCSWPGPW